MGPVQVSNRVEDGGIMGDVLWFCFRLRSVNTKIPQLEEKLYPSGVHWDYHEYKLGVTCVRVLNDLKGHSFVHLIRIMAF